MAKDKKSFVLYVDQKTTIELLTDEQAGKLLKHLYKYVSDENPELDDLLIKLAFEPIKQQLKRDLKKYEGTKEDRSKAGRIGNLKRYHIDLYNKYNDSDLTLEEAESIAKTRKVSHSEKVVANVAVNVNDNVNENEINNKPTKVDSFNWDILLHFINQKTGRQFRTINKLVRKSFNARLNDGYTKKDIMNSIINACNNDYHKENGRQYLTPEFLSRASTLDKYSSEAKPEPKFNPNAQPVN